MGLDNEITLTLNADELLQELAKVEAKANEVEDVVEVVKETSTKTFRQVMGGVHALWLTTQGVVRAAGGSIETVFRTMVGTVLGAVSTLAPIFAAKAVAGDFISAALGMASIALATSALVASEQEQKDVSNALRGANMALHGLQSFIGGFHWG